MDRDTTPDSNDENDYIGFRETTNPLRTPRNSIDSTASVIVDAPIGKLSPSEERDTIIRKIGQYKQNFPDTCILVDMKMLRYMNISELNDYLANIRYLVSTRNTSTLVKSEIDKIVRVAEYFCSAKYPQLEGIHAELSANQAYQDCLTELGIEYGALGYIRPEIRLFYLLLGTWLDRVRTDQHGEKSN